MKAYILLCNGFEEVEALATADVLKRAGVEVVLAAPYGDKYVNGSHGIVVGSDVQVSEGDCCCADASSVTIDALKDADAVILPGGQPGTNNLMKHAGVVNLVKEYNKAGKLVCAICAAPMVLGENGLLDFGGKDNGPRDCTCFPGCENGLGNGHHVGGPAVTDGNIITGKSMGCAIDFALAIVSKLMGAEKAAAVEASIYRS